MSYGEQIPMDLLRNLAFLLQECGPDSEAEPAEIDAVARVAGRLTTWIRQAAPEGLPTCHQADCGLTATDGADDAVYCAYHAPATGNADEAHRSR